MDIESDMNVSYVFQDEVEGLIHEHHVNLMMVSCLNDDALTVATWS